MMKHLVIALIRLYQLCISPLIGNACRFYPSCSCYAVKVITNYGALKGSWLTLKRLAKCGPWHPGGYDAPPECSHGKLIDKLDRAKDLANE